MRQRRVNITKILLGCFLLFHLRLLIAPVITVRPLDPPALPPVPLMAPGATPGPPPVPLAAVLQELLDGGGVTQGSALASLASGARC